MATVCSLRQRVINAADVAEMYLSDATATLKTWQDRLVLKSGGKVLPNDITLKDVLDSMIGKAEAIQNQDVAYRIDPLNNALIDAAKASGQTIDQFRSGVSAHIRMEHIIERVQEFMLRRKNAAAYFTEEGKALRAQLILDRELAAVNSRVRTPAENQAALDDIIARTRELFDPDNGYLTGDYMNGTKYEGYTWADAIDVRDSLPPEYAQFYASNYQLFEEIRNTLKDRMSQARRNGPIKEFIRDSLGFRHYVPFKTAKSDADLESFLKDYDVWESTGYLNDQDPEVMKGRVTAASDPIIQLQTDLLRSGSTLVNSEVEQKLLETINFYGNDVANVEQSVPLNTTPIRDRGNIYDLGKRPKDGRIQRKANTVVIHNGDQDIVVTIKDPDLFLGLKNHWLRSNKKLSKIYAWTMRPFARLKTFWNAPWAFYTNFIREFRQQLVYGALDLGYDKTTGKYDMSIPKAYMANVLRFGGFKDAINFYVKDQLGKDQLEAQGSEFAKWANLLSRLGGESTFMQSMNFEANQTRLEELYAEAMNTDVSKIKAAWKRAHNFYEGALNGVDLSTRVALFKSIVESGKMSPQAAAIYVKNLMNFNYKGKYGDWLRMAYVFYGPSAAGVFRMMHTVMRTGNPAQLTVLAGMYAAGAAFWYMMANAILGVDDDGEDKLKKVDNDTVIRNDILPIMGDNQSIPIVPKAIGLETIISGLGVLTARAMLGHTTGERAVVSGIKGLIDNSSFVAPADPGEGGTADDTVGAAMLTVVPSLIRPLTEIYFNKTSQGLDIWSPYLRSDTPKYMQAKSSTDDTYVTMSKFLFDNFNGLDISPESIKHNTMQYLGFLGTSVNRFVSLEEKVLRGEPLTAGDIPGMPNISTKDVKYYPQRVFATVRNEWEEQIQQYKAAEDRREQPSELSRLAKSLMDDMRRIDRRIATDIKAIEDSTFLSKEEKARRQKALLDTRQKIRSELVERWRAEK